MAKIHKVLRTLAKVANVGGKVEAKLVARLVGQLWAASIVCYRAVTIMARGMIATIAVMIRLSEVRDVTDLNRLRYILKRVWGGQVTWTDQAHRELLFWLRVSVAALSAPISFDAVTMDLDTWVISHSRKLYNCVTIGVKHG